MNRKGAWVSERGLKSPFWRVIVHPGKALEVNLRGKDAGILSLTHQKQNKNKWNTAMKTVVKALINKEVFQGCCRAVQLR